MMVVDVLCRRMNAVRIRKENQVLNAEEKRAMAMYSYEEKVGREADLMNQFKVRKKCHRIVALPQGVRCVWANGARRRVSSNKRDWTADESTRIHSPDA